MTGPLTAVASLSLGRFSAAAAASSVCLQSSQDVINAFRCVSLVVVVVSHRVLQIYDLAHSLARSVCVYVCNC